MKITTNIFDIDSNQWDLLLKESKNKSIFQSRDWYNFCMSVTILEPFVFALTNDEKILKGVIVGYIQKDGGRIKQFFSKRAIINGGPLLANDITIDEVCALLRCVAKGLNGKAIYIESRNLSDYSCYRSAFEKTKFKYSAHLNFHIDTTNIEVINKNLHRNKRRQIKSSEKEGVIIDKDPTFDDLKDFYAMLREMYINKVKTPLPPYSFFETLFKQTFSHFIVIRKDGELIAGLILLELKEDTIYQYYLSGEDGVYQSIYPSVMATYAGIVYATNNNCKKCDLMGAGKPNEKYGVRNFKAGFGGQLVEYGRFYCVKNHFLYYIGVFAVKCIKFFK